MATKSVTIEGTSYWFKALGAPGMNYNEDGKEWSFEVSPNEESLLDLKKWGLEANIKNKGGDRGDFVQFRRPEINKMRNEPNKPIPVTDADGAAWPDDVSIGNGSTIRVKFSVLDMPAKGKFKGGKKLIPYEVKVLKLVEYKRPDTGDGRDSEAAQPSPEQVAEAKGEKWNG